MESMSAPKPQIGSAVGPGVRAWQGLFNAEGLPLGKRLLLALVAVAIGAALWVPCLHLLFRIDVADYYRPSGVPPKVREIARHHMDLWTIPELREREISRMRGSNAEWDFMGRTFLVLSLANLGLREPASKTVYLEVIDRIIDETLRLEKEKGIYFFLMPYAKSQPFIASPVRSIFIDGEIALMMGARCMVEPREEYRPLLRERVRQMETQMRQSPVLSAESYPNECWTFCNSVALASMRIFDVLEGDDHDAFLAEWLAVARRRLIHEPSGLLVSSYMLDGTIGDGPEGSTLWMISHCLELVDPEFAADQYQRARKELMRTVIGFPYAIEWPASCKGSSDIDSGPIIPVLEVSAGATGLAFLGAAAFGDTELLGGLLSSLEFGGFPIRRAGALRYGASNQVGDAVLLYALTNGPLWREVQARRKK